MSLETEITDLATTIAASVNTAKSERGVLGTLSTTNKSSLVAALNELKGLIDAISSVTINDAATTSSTETWSVTKINSEIGLAISSLIDGAPGALDTLNEIATALQDDANSVSSILSAQAKRVAVDQAQAFSGPEQVQARANIDAASATDIGDTARDFAADFTAALT